MERIQDYQLIMINFSSVLFFFHVVSKCSIKYAVYLSDCSYIVITKNCSFNIFLHAVKDIAKIFNTYFNICENF